MPVVGTNTEAKPPRRMAVLMLSGTLLLTLLAAWHWTPLSEWMTTEQVTLWMDGYAHSPLAAGWVALGYVLASITLFPRPLLTLGVSIVFGPWLGMFYALAGIVVAALSNYALGRVVKRDTVRRFAGERLNTLSQLLCRYGFMGMVVLRMLPLAPFIVVNMVAGAIRLRAMPFAAATVLGMAPGVVAMTVFGGQVNEHLRNQGEINGWLTALVMLAAAVAAYFLHRLSRRKLAALQAQTLKDGAATCNRQ